MTQTISYSNNAEDIVLKRLFGSQGFGRYIDVGASFPSLGSVTKIFYDDGWSGVNIEPAPNEYEQLVASRPRDINLRVAVSNFIGSADLYLGLPEQYGLGTLDPDVAKNSLGEEATSISVPVTTLAQIVETYVTGPIDFLKIDVEGLEYEVIAGADWRSFRPRVVVVEATAPNSTKGTHEGWEQILLEAGYACALFEGLNRFYAQTSDFEAISLLSVAANVHDKYVSFDMWSVMKHNRELVEKIGVLEGQCSDLGHRLRALSIADDLRSTQEQLNDPVTEFSTPI
jgi:FkbM family methyltransferase